MEFKMCFVCSFFIPMDDGYSFFSTSQVHFEATGHCGVLIYDFQTD